MAARPLLALLLLVTACSEESAASQTIVGSIYPLAFAAERMAPQAEVIDLTPPGVEAHDLELTLAQRSDIQDADTVIYLGPIGFQPQVESGVVEAEGTVVDLSGDLARPGGVVDPHAWLEPSSFARMVATIREALCPADDPCSVEVGSRIEAFEAKLAQLHNRYTDELASCRYRVMIVSHEAFGYLELYGFEQVGLSGLTPESEPSADRLSNARQLVESGEAAALFYEARGEDVQSAQVLADDLGVAALPLDTLESQPETGDYLSVMGDNLESLREGLECL